MCPIMLCSLCTVLLPCLALPAKVICAALEEYRMHNYSESTQNMLQIVFTPFTLIVTVRLVIILSSRLCSRIICFNKDLLLSVD